MGVRGELFSTKVALQNRTYFFNVKENRVGDLYLNIVESKNRDEGGFDRQSVILFAEDLQEFLQGFDESLKVLEKAVREKRRGPSKKFDGEGRDSAPRPPRQSHSNASSHRTEGRPRNDDRAQWGKSDGRDSPRFHDGPRPRRKDYGSGGEPRPFQGSATGGGGESRPYRGRSDSRDKGKFQPGKKRVVVRKK